MLEEDFPYFCCGEFAGFRLCPIARFNTTGHLQVLLQIAVNPRLSHKYLANLPNRKEIIEGVMQPRKNCSREGTTNLLKRLTATTSPTNTCSSDIFAKKKCIFRSFSQTLRIPPFSGETNRVSRANFEPVPVALPARLPGPVFLQDKCILLFPLFLVLLLRLRSLHLETRKEGCLVSGG